MCHVCKEKKKKKTNQQHTNNLHLGESHRTLLPSAEGTVIMQSAEKFKQFQAPGQSDLLTTITWKPGREIPEGIRCSRKEILLLPQYMISQSDPTP